jgi:hypothetical protein
MFSFMLSVSTKKQNLNFLNYFIIYYDYDFNSG